MGTFVNCCGKKPSKRPHLELLDRHLVETTSSLETGVVMSPNVTEILIEFDVLYWLEEDNDVFGTRNVGLALMRLLSD